MSSQRGWWAVGAALVILVLLAGQFVTAPFYVGVLIQVLFWAAAASAWNISGGFAGQLSLGHAAFFGVGAYTSSILFSRFGISPWLGLLVGALLGALMSFVIGGVSIRLRGPFFSMVTIAFQEMARIVAVNWHPVTNGANGIELPFKVGLANFTFAGKTPYLYVALAFTVAYFLIAHSIQRSRLGYYLVAFRENEEAARALGIHTLRVKLIALAISAALTAALGTFYAQYVQFVDPDSVFGADFSIQVALLAIVGGMGTPLGPLLGSILITPVGQFLLATLGGARSGLYLLIYGLILIVVMLFLPEGLLGAFWRVRRRRSSAPLTPARETPVDAAV